MKVGSLKIFICMASLLLLTSTVWAEAIIPVKRVYNNFERYWANSTEFDINRTSQWDTPRGVVKTYRGMFVSISAHSNEKIVNLRLIPKSQVEVKNADKSLIQSNGTCDANSTEKDVQVFGDSQEFHWTKFTLDYANERSFSDKDSTRVQRNYTSINVALSTADYIQLSKCSDIKFVICENTYELTWAQRQTMLTLGTFLMP